MIISREIFFALPNCDIIILDLGRHLQCNDNGRL